MQDLKNLKCLLPETGKLLTALIDTADFLNNYVLARGSGLALYLCHRKSEDLDFFTYENSLKDIYDCSKDIIEGINFKLFASALVYIDDIKDDNINHLEPAKQLSKQDIRSFFETELSKSK